MVREIRRGSAVPSAHTYAASTHEVNQSRAKGCPAAATIPTVWFVAVCRMGRRMIERKSYDGIERGMLFHFINSNIENQYEFVLRRWVNDSEFAGAVRLHPKSKDPLIGTQDPAESIFVIPHANGGPPVEITGLSTFVTTKAAAYLFLPSLTAIKFIASFGEGPQSTTG